MRSSKTSELKRQVNAFSMLCRARSAPNIANLNIISYATMVLAPKIHLNSRRASALLTRRWQFPFYWPKERAFTPFTCTRAYPDSSGRSAIQPDASRFNPIYRDKSRYNAINQNKTAIFGPTIPRVSPSCPKCGKPMVRRMQKKGQRQGLEFRGRADYPNRDGIKSP